MDPLVQRVILGDLWKGISKNGDWISHKDLRDIFKAHNIDLTEANRNEISSLIVGSRHNEIFYHEWCDYWDTTVPSEFPYWSKFQQLHTKLLQNIDRNNIPNKANNISCCYQWRFPRYQTYDIQQLFYGYIKENVSKLFIPYDVICICCNYYYQKSMLDQIKMCDGTHRSFISGTFKYKSCKFRLKLKVFSKGQISFFIESIPSSDTVYPLSFKYSFSIIEKFIGVEGQTARLNYCGDYTRIDLGVLLHRKDILHLDTLTINLLVHDERNKLRFTTLTPCILENDSAAFNWVLSDEEINKIRISDDAIKSDIFLLHGLKWQLWIWSDGDILLICISLPIDAESISLYHQIRFNGKRIKRLKKKNRNHRKIFHAGWYFDTLERGEILWYDKALKKNRPWQSRNPTLQIEIALSHFDYKHRDQQDNHKVIQGLDNFCVNNSTFGDMKSCAWELPEAILEGKIKSLCSCTRSFFSDLFIVDGFTFMMEFYPRQIRCGKQQCVLKLHLLSSHMKHISYNYTYRIKELDIEYSWHSVACPEDASLTPYLLDYDCISIEEIVLLDTLIFICDIHILDVMDQYGQLLENKCSSVRQSPVTLSEVQQFTWNPSVIIQNTIFGDAFMSGIFILFGLKWYLWFIPKPCDYSNHIHLSLCLADLPPDISEITIYSKVIIEEIAVARSNVIRFSASSMEYEFFDEEVSYGDYRDELNLGDITFILQMSLINVHDIEGLEQTNKFRFSATKKVIRDQEFIGHYEWGKVDNPKFWKWLDPEWLKWIYAMTGYTDICWYEFHKYGLQYRVKFATSPAPIEIIMKSLPKWMKQISIRCQIKFIEENVEICGVVHFNQNKLESILSDVVNFSRGTTRELIFKVSMQEVAMHTDGNKINITQGDQMCC